MPTRKYSRRKRYNRRTTYRSRYARKAKKLYVKEGVSAKVRLVGTLTSDGTGSINSYNGLNDPHNAQDWTNFSTLYDSYRVQAMKVQFIPQLPNNVSATTTYTPIYTIFDAEDIDVTFLNTVNIFLQYENCKVHNLFRPWKRYFKIPKSWEITQGSQSNQVVMKGGWIDVANYCTNGVFAYIAQGLTASTTYGSFIVTWYVQFKNRR